MQDESSSFFLRLHDTAFLRGILLVGRRSSFVKRLEPRHGRSEASVARRPATVGRCRKGTFSYVKRLLLNVDLSTAEEHKTTPTRTPGSVYYSLSSIVGAGQIQYVSTRSYVLSA